MTCTECSRETIAFTVPEELRECVPENASAAATCISCLTLQPPTADQPTPEDPDLTRISDAFPADSSAAIACALATGLMDSLALNRTELETLVEYVEERGVDPMLVFDRLAKDPDLNPAMDVAGRRHQLQQLLE